MITRVHKVVEARWCTFKEIRQALGEPRPGHEQTRKALNILALYGRLFRIDDRGEFTVAYFQKLDRIGVATIRKRLQEISDQHGGRGLALLCWEDIRKPGEWCHRQVFAEWWPRETGEAIVELETGAKPRVSSPGILQLPLC